MDRYDMVFENGRSCFLRSLRVAYVGSIEVFGAESRTDFQCLPMAFVGKPSARMAVEHTLQVCVAYTMANEKETHIRGRLARYKKLLSGIRTVCGRKPFKKKGIRFTMGLFSDRFSQEASLFRDENSLNYEFLPKLLPFRENQQQYLADCLKPLLHGRAGRNVLIHGAPGIGKTAASRAVLRELEDTTDQVRTIYVNCWQRNSTFKILVEICESFGYRLTHNKKSDELMDIIEHNLNKKGVVLVFDEIDKVEDTDFLYFLLERVYKKSIILITNYEDWLVDLDERIKSRLTAEVIEFEPYKLNEVKIILQQRLPFAFQDDVWEAEALDLIARATTDYGDIRMGLYLLREAGNIAEEKFAKKVTVDHAKAAIGKLEKFTIKKQTSLAEEEQVILKLAQDNPDQKIGDVYRKYQEAGGQSSYKTFQRKINHLAENRFIATEKVVGGKEGTTTIIKSLHKKLTDF
jgi:archaeal cell division control protein 6